MNRRASRILTVCAAVWLSVIWGHSCIPATQSGAESGTLAALCDETIQLFVPGRSGQIADVWLDTAGYLTGTLLTLLIFRLCRKRSEA